MPIIIFQVDDIGTKCIATNITTLLQLIKHVDDRRKFVKFVVYFTKINVWKLRLFKEQVTAL